MATLTQMEAQLKVLVDKRNDAETLVKQCQQQNMDLAAKKKMVLALIAQNEEEQRQNQVKLKALEETVAVADKTELTMKQFTYHQ